MATGLTRMGNIPAASCLSALRAPGPIGSVGNLRMRRRLSFDVCSDIEGRSSNVMELHSSQDMGGERGPRAVQPANSGPTNLSIADISYSVLNVMLRGYLRPVTDGPGGGVDS